MDKIYSCRNCIHNGGQSLLIGRGYGFCIKHDSVICKPSQTTCKYLHRKDLPYIVVDEGLREHASEFAGFSAMADLITHEPIPRLRYSEKFVWERRQFDPVNHSLALYHKTNPTWIFLQTMSGGIDGRRSLAHASVVRRYMDNCGTWQSSYRFILLIIQELSLRPIFNESDLNDEEGDIGEEIYEDAIWDVFFTRLAGIQEYGFHSGIEELMWATDKLNGALVSLDWMKLKNELNKKTEEWTQIVIEHASKEGEFFKMDESVCEIGNQYQF
ncbi:MAG: hypothetical protein AB7S75_17720 [Desulfococcaceae bacterium]